MSEPVHRRRPTIKDVAELAGVSAATVSYVLGGRGSGRSSGSRETQERVRAAADQLGYRPNRAARGARTGLSKTILVAMPDLDDPWTTATIQAIRDMGLRWGLSVLVLPSDDWFDVLAALPVDAAFISRPTVQRANRSQIQTLVNQGLRLVVFSDSLKPQGFDVISSSPMEAVRLAARELAPTGDVVFVASHRIVAHSQARERWAAFADEMAKLGKQVDPTRDGVVGGPDEISAFLDSRRPSAVITETVGAAVTTYIEAARLGISIPDQLQILAVGTVPDSVASVAPLSYVGEVDVFGRIADIVVKRALDVSVPPQLFDLPNVVVHRSTTRPGDDECQSLALG